MGNSSGRDAKKILARKRQAEALEMRKAGCSLEEVAKKMGLRHRSSARKLIQRALKAIIADNVDDLRMIQHMRLEQSLRAIWVEVLKGNQGAIATSLRIHERQAALMGLDAVVQKDIRMIDETGPTPGKAAALMREQFSSTTPDEEAQRAGDSEPAGGAAEE